MAGRIGRDLRLRYCRRAADAVAGRGNRLDVQGKKEAENVGGAALRQVGYLDTLAAQDTSVHRLDPRAKLLTTLAYVLAVVSFGKYEISALLPFAVYPLWLAAAGNIPFPFVAKKLLIVSPFIIFVGVFNPLLDRQTLMQIGSLELSGGWVSFLSIALRATLTLSAVMILLGTTGMNSLAAAADRLGVPRVFVVQLLFLYRYLFVLAEEALRLSRARALRSFGSRGTGLRPYAGILGHLLLRTLDRAERIHQAMLARGFDGEVRLLRTFRFGTREVLFVCGWVALFVTLRSVNLARLIGEAVTGVLP
jgi:cobalt/nickel transport system permease protein